jgi:hypothetical protein
MPFAGGHIRLRTWTPHQRKGEHDFYILSKGDHAGRPMDKSCPNCFIVRCKDQEERTNLYGLCLALWHAGSFRQYIRGSVVPFIIIGHVEGLLTNAYLKFQAAPDQQRLHIKTLEKLDQLEKTKHKEIALIRQLKQALAQKHFYHDVDWTTFRLSRRRRSI